MLSEIIKLCKRLAGWIKTNNRELYLTAVIVLVATISFGLGRLSKIREEKTPITIENATTPTETATKASDKNVTEKMLEQNLGNISNSQKIFVASRNGKKYYYAWCESANVIKEANRIWFSTKDEAEKSGYQPAANCKGLK